MPDKPMLDAVHDPESLTIPSLETPAMARAVELARQLLREKGLADHEIETELNKPSGQRIETATREIG